MSKVHITGHVVGSVDENDLRNVIHKEVKLLLAVKFGPEWEEYLEFLSKDDRLQARFVAAKAAKRILEGSQ